jgi:hypothetical protein
LYLTVQPCETLGNIFTKLACTIKIGSWVTSV